jgi:hypothetical protein
VIIWGSTGREIEQDHGEFHCPECNAPAEYKKVRVATYFTLYFIPLFETQHHGDYVECLSCRGKYRPEVLDYKPPTDLERVLSSVRQDLESGTPVQMARIKLTNAGIEEELAGKLVAAAVGDVRRTCAGCKLDFVSSVRRCSVCGGSLATETRFTA